MKILYMLTAALLTFTLTTPAYAAADEELLQITSQAAQALKVDDLADALPDQAHSRLEGFLPSDIADPGEMLQTLLGNVLDESKTIWKTGIRSALSILGVAVLCALAQGLLKSLEHQTPVVTIAGVLSVTVITLGQSGGMLSAARSAIGEMNLFSKALLPVMTAACTAAGQAVSAAGRHTVVVFLTDVVITAIDAALVPLLYSCIALQLAGAVSGSDALTKLTTQLKNLLHSILRTVLTLFMSYFALSGVITGSADAMALKTTKLMLSSALPVVGSIMSDAAGAVLIGAKIVHGSAGVFGLLGLAAIGLVPFAQIGVRYLCMRLAAMFSGLGADAGFSKFVDGIADSFGLLVGLYGTCMLLLLLSVFAGMSAWGMG
ncbi:MAG: hypothetical protein E7463_03385 [Ruminococcaceae bacterium]|nr:hypothetical protein [Oscillospiraceae bacterium]